MVLRDLDRKWGVLPGSRLTERGYWEKSLYTVGYIASSGYVGDLRVLEKHGFVCGLGTFEDRGYMGFTEDTRVYGGFWKIFTSFREFYIFRVRGAFRVSGRGP